MFARSSRTKHGRLIESPVEVLDEYFPSPLMNLSPWENWPMHHHHALAWNRPMDTRQRLRDDIDVLSLWARLRR